MPPFSSIVRQSVSSVRHSSMQLVGFAELFVDLVQDRRRFNNFNESFLDLISKLKNDRIV